MKKYSVHFLCEVSQTGGMDRLISSCLLARELERHNNHVMISVLSLNDFTLPVEIADQKLNIVTPESIDDVLVNGIVSDLYILDLPALPQSTQSILMEMESLILGLSFINNYARILDLYIGRKKLETHYNQKVVQYVDVGNCIFYPSKYRLDDQKYLINLSQEMLEIGIFMGGNCGFNDYSNVFSALSSVLCKANLKIVIGQESALESRQIESLARTHGIMSFVIKKCDGFESAWNFLSHCSIVLCSRELTALECVYKGLPFVCLAHNEHQLIEVTDFVEAGCGFSMRINEHDSIPALFKLVNYLAERPGLLEWMNKMCVSYFPNQKTSRYISIIDEFMKEILLKNNDTDRENNSTRALPCCPV